MAYVFFYSSIAVLIVLFLVCCTLRPLRLSNIIIGLATIGYSLANDILFGDHFKLFHYINTEESTLFIVIAAVFIYPLLNILYTLFLPDKGQNIFIYTLCWIIAMIAFEYASVITKTIVFTGWKPIPWSFVTYVIAYFWIYFFYKFITNKMSDVK